MKILPREVELTPLLAHPPERRQYHRIVWVQAQRLLEERLGCFEVLKYGRVDVPQRKKRRVPFRLKLARDLELRHCRFDIVVPQVGPKVYVGPSVAGLEFDGLSQVAFGLFIR